MDKDKQSFVLYRSWAVYLLALPDQQAAQLIKAICAAETGTDYAIDDPMLEIYFSSVVLPELQKNDERYERKRQNAIESARKRTQAIESERKRTQASESVHVSVSESVSDSVSVSVSESVSASEKEKKGAAHSAYDSDPELNSAIKDFVDQRKKMRKPMTDRAIQLFQNRLESLSKGDKALKIQMIDTAIERGWQTVYPPKEEKRGSTYIDAIRNRYDGIDEWAQGGETSDKSGV